MSGRKPVDWTIVIVAIIVCGAFGLVEIAEADDVSTDEFRRWLGSVAVGIGGLLGYKFIRHD